MNASVNGMIGSLPDNTQSQEFFGGSSAGCLAEYCWRTAQEANKNAVEINYEINVRNKESGVEETIRELHSIRYFFIPEMMSFCASAGLDVIAASEWLTDREPSLTTRNVYFAGRATTGGA